MLEDVREYIKQLIARYEAVKAENENLRQELLSCKQTAEAQKAKILEMESEISTLFLSQAFSATPGPEAKAKIDQMIREIDKCISALEES